MVDNTSPLRIATPSARCAKMLMLLKEWEAEIENYPVGCLELHFNEKRVVAILKISLGQKKD